ncbi:MAG: cytochrome c-type bioproteinis protein CcmH [Gallionellaceae bacterium]|nr:MAG: cytochrome c-type bioproteinis protein CcmH [Gallionellaceae bacterium]
MLTRALFLIFLALALPQAYAGEAEPTADDVALEKRVMAVSEELRCLVCQNQTIADSHAELAIDLKNQVREKLRQGMSEREIVDYMVERYGDFVLYRPLVKSSTWLLWFGPFILLLVAAGVLVAKLRQRRKAMQEAPKLNADDHARAESLLSGTDNGAKS